VNVARGTKVCDLFTRRNLYALSAIYDAIESIEDAKVKQFMRFCFTASLGQASKLVFVIRKRGRQAGQPRETKEVGSWATRGYWVPPEYFEINAWDCFEERFKKLLRGKQETNAILGDAVKEASCFEELADEKNFLVLNQSATDLSNIPSNSIDYVFTDPPYGDAVPYLELDLMWASWLKMSANFDDEIIISDSPVRKKDFEQYYRMLIQAFREVYRVLKPSHWLTVTFHSTDVKIYNSIIRAVVFAGFQLEKVLYQHPARSSPKALLAPYGSAVGDYYLRFRKPVRARRVVEQETDLDLTGFENIVVESVKGIMAQRGQPVTYSDILKDIYAELDKHGYLLAAKPERIEEILARHKGKEFEFLEGRGWWLRDPSEYFLHVIPLNERIEEAVVQLLRQKDKVSFDRILQELFVTFKNALTPEPRSVMSILQEYALKTKDGKWKLKPSVETRESEHSKMVFMLCQLGVKLGSFVFSGHPATVFEGKTVADMRGYRDIGVVQEISPENLRKIREIDVVWHKAGKITHIFEVENTTGITDALVRGSNVPYAAKRYIVLPEERDALLQSKIKEPMLAGQFGTGGWEIMYYGTLTEFVEEHKRKRFQLAHFEAIAGVKSKRLTLTDTGQLALVPSDD
jgi:hypothetical protein